MKLLDINQFREARYGENPHQKAQFYLPEEIRIVREGKKKISSNNIRDIIKGAKALIEFEEGKKWMNKLGIKEKYFAGYIKHRNFCGAAFGKTQLEACEKALKYDPESPFGSFLVISSELNIDFDKKRNELFQNYKTENRKAPWVEGIIAPKIDERICEYYDEIGKKNIRLIEVDVEKYKERLTSQPEMISEGGAIILQDYSLGISKNEEELWEICSEREPTKEEEQNAYLALFTTYLNTSNAVTITKDLATIGVSMGQPHRSDGIWIAYERTKRRLESETRGRASEKDLEKQLKKLFKGSASSTCSYPPNPDEFMKMLYEIGCTAHANPGIAHKEELEKAANEYGIALMITKKRMFTH